MLAQLKKMLEVRESPCLTIALNTHRTKPDSLKDAIVLKNMVNEAKKRLIEEFDHTTCGPVLRNLDQLSEQIDHNYNLDSMVLFVSASMSELLRLPVPVKERVIIGDRFSIRDVARATNEESRYYLLVMSRRYARLIEAYNDTLVHEFDDELFPMENTIIETDPLILTMPQGQDNIRENWFVSVNNALVRRWNERPLPVIVVAEKSNFDHFMNLDRPKDQVVGHLNRTRDAEEAKHIIPEAWVVMKDYLRARTTERIDELRRAVTTGYFFTDYNDIWRSVREGSGRTLFVKRGLIKAAILVDGGIRLVDEPVPSEAEMVEDIVDLMIAENLLHGGDIVFLEGDELAEFQDLAITTRY